MSALTVNESIVRAVQAPTPTETWHPFNHSVLLDELEFARELAGLEISSHRYELSKDGRKFFGVWNFMDTQWSKEVCTSIGFRNSIDKSISVGLTAGTYVMVCSNMAFSGEWLLFRKHTKNVLEDLKYFAMEAFGVCLKRARREAVLQEEMNLAPLSEKEWKVLTYDCISQGILPPTKAMELFVPGLERNLGVWFNVVTNTLSQRSLLNTETQYSNLRRLVEPYVEVS